MKTDLANSVILRLQRVQMELLQNAKAVALTGKFKTKAQAAAMRLRFAN